MGFIGSSMEAGDTGESSAAFEEEERAHQTRLACLRRKINGVVGAEIVKEEKGGDAFKVQRA